MGKREMSYLSDVPSDKAFWVNNGPVLKNLYELQDALDNMSEDTFSYHANSEKNDFSKWISEVVGDARLANELQRAKSRLTALDKVKKRVANIKK